MPCPRSRSISALVASLAIAASACGNDAVGPSAPTPTPSATACTGSPIQLDVAAAARADCSNGGTQVVLPGNGASYLIAAQFPVSLVADLPAAYRLTSSSSATAVIAGSFVPSPVTTEGFEQQHGVVPGRAQRSFDFMLRERARAAVASGAWPRRVLAAPHSTSFSLAPSPPALGSVRGFRVLSSATSAKFTGVTARLAFAGANVLLYIDTLAPAGGFTPDQLTTFGRLFDQTLYPIDTAAFGPPSDVDANGRIIMLMSPVVNALSPLTSCQTNGFVAGFFDDEDLGGSAADSNSNHGEVFYTIVPDPNGTTSCGHTVADVGETVPATFLHELQHLISFSQHFVVHGGEPEYGWLDEGMSIVAEELGSAYYEQKCPGTACRSNPAQLFPDSSQGFIRGFLFDSYLYALRPDTASVTLHSDSDDGFSWRGGDWLLARWLGDQFGQRIYRAMDENTATGVANIVSASGQPFPSLFANFGLALVVDSLPGLPRTTAPAADRFVTRNMRQLWARLFATSSGPQFPRAFPIILSPITTDTTAHSMVPGTSAYYRLDTPANEATVTLRFTAPSGAPLSAALAPQLAVFRLPPGQ